jgi:hypothetical protein
MSNIQKYQLTGMDARIYSTNALPYLFTLAEEKFKNIYVRYQDAVEMCIAKLNETLQHKEQVLKCPTARSGVPSRDAILIPVVAGISGGVNSYERPIYLV